MLYTEHFEVSSHDTDPNNIARASSVLRYMQETANHQMRDQKPSYSELFEQGMAFVLSRIRMSLYHPLHQYDKIDVQSWPCESRGASFNRCYRIYKDGLIIAEAASIWALVGTKDRKLYRNNDVDFSNYSFGEPVELDLPGRFHIPQEVNLSLVGERTIEYGDIDCNRHMNNTNYPDMLCGYIPEMDGNRVISMCINFISEAPLGESLKIYCGNSESEYGSKLYYFRTVKSSGINVEAEIMLEKI